MAILIANAYFGEQKNNKIERIETKQRWLYTQIYRSITTINSNIYNNHNIRRKMCRQNHPSITVPNGIHFFCGPPLQQDPKWSSNKCNISST
jgi:hypothetical protein